MILEMSVALTYLDGKSPVKPGLQIAPINNVRNLRY